MGLEGEEVIHIAPWVDGPWGAGVLCTGHNFTWSFKEVSSFEMLTGQMSASSLRNLHWGR